MIMEAARYILRMRMAQNDDGLEGERKGFISVFHFNPNHRMDHCLDDIVVDKITGMMRAMVRYEGMTKKNNTFFPSSWSAEQVIEEIQTALINPVRVEVDKLE